jgi:hypothetical protein
VAPGGGWGVLKRPELHQGERKREAFMAFVLFFSARSCLLRLPVGRWQCESSRGLSVRVRPACAEVDLLDCLDSPSCLFSPIQHGHFLWFRNSNPQLDSVFRA